MRHATTVPAAQTVATACRARRFAYQRRRSCAAAAAARTQRCCCAATSGCAPRRAFARPARVACAFAHDLPASSVLPQASSQPQRRRTAGSTPSTQKADVCAARQRQPKIACAKRMRRYQMQIARVAAAMLRQRVPRDTPRTIAQTAPHALMICVVAHVTIAPRSMPPPRCPRHAVAHAIPRLISPRLRVRALMSCDFACLMRHAAACSAAPTRCASLRRHASDDCASWHDAAPDAAAPATITQPAAPSAPLACRGSVRRCRMR